MLCQTFELFKLEYWTKTALMASHFICCEIAYETFSFT